MNKYSNDSKLLKWLMVLVFAGVAYGCGMDDDNGSSAASAAAGPIGVVCVGADCVPLGTAANYALLAKTGIATVPSSAVTGNVGVRPAARPFLTGWSLITVPTDTYSQS